MNEFLIACVLGLALPAPPIAPQGVTARRPPATKPAPIVTAGTGGSFLAAADDCNSAHTNLGTGSVFGIPFDTSVQTTGTTGQNEANCLLFGTTGVQNDGWGDWTASTTGTGVVDTCSSSIDTKIAVYPLSTCPADGTSIACNDDACGGNGLQSSVGWSITAGTTYTIQMGSFPGASQGAGTFDVVEYPPGPCGQRDDGSTENALGLTLGGEIGWMTEFEIGPGECLQAIDSVAMAYGTLMFPGSVTNGANSRIVVYEQIDMDPDPTGATISGAFATVVVNGDTDILNKVPLGTKLYTTPTRTRRSCMITADHVAGQFPAPMDQTPPVHTLGTWFVGSTLGPGTLDIVNLGNNTTPPTNMNAAGLPCNFLIRVEHTTGSAIGTPLCFGDGTGAACGCANESDPSTGGCRNSVSGTQGAFATASGTASQDQTTDELTFDVTNVRTQPGLFFCANNTIGGGAGATFGDGIRCCGGGLVRVETINPPPGPEPVTVTTTTQLSPAPPGSKRCYQYWYRDPGGPCGSNFNLSNAVSVTWGP